MSLQLDSSFENVLERNLALETVRVTEAAALSASRLVGMGDEKAADQAAVDAMRKALKKSTVKWRAWYSLTGPHTNVRVMSVVPSSYWPPESSRKNPSAWTAVSTPSFKP